MIKDSVKPSKITVRQRQFTYYEMLAFAQYYASHRNESSPEILLVSFLRWKNVDGEFSLEARKILIIEEAVCRYYGISVADLRSGRRYGELVKARQVIAYIAVEEGKIAQRKVAQILNTKRDNIQYQKTQTAKIMDVDRRLRQEVEELVILLKPKLEDIDAQIRQLLREAKMPEPQEEKGGEG